MADNFTVTKTEKETKTGRTITIDIKRNDNGSKTISGDIENVVRFLGRTRISDLPSSFLPQTARSKQSAWIQYIQGSDPRRMHSVSKVQTDCQA